MKEGSQHSTSTAASDQPRGEVDAVVDARSAVIERFWSQRFRDPLALVAEASALLQSAQQPAMRAFAWLQLGWGYRYHGDLAAATDALTQASTIYERLGDRLGLASCRDLDATLKTVARRHDEALALLQANLDLPRGSRHPIERVITHDRVGVLQDLLGERDESLRHRYAMLDAARESNDGAATAFALAILGGVQADLYNLEDAERLCREGVALAESCQAVHAGSLAALNHMNALLAMERGEEAAVHAERLLVLEPRLSQRAAEQRLIVYADAFTATGDPHRAQALLDRSLALRSDRQHSLISFTTAQIRTWNALQQPDRARALGEAYLADPDNGTDPAQVPAELLRILQALARACETLGDLRAALDYQKQAFAVHESLVGRSARARRLTLEIQHRLDRERWEREEAQRRQHDAEIEGARLSALNHQLDAALQTRTRFLAAASHDLRQPAHALALYAMALEQETSRDALHAVAKRVRATVHSLSGMFDGLIDLARLDADAVEVRPEVVNVDELLARLRTEYGDRPRMGGGRVSLRRTRQPLLLRTDAVLMERILRNLIGNALKYAAQGNILVAIRWCSAGARAIEVRDAGPGIAVADQPRVFDEFFQASGASGNRDGLGLGLAIVQRFSRLLGIKVSLKSVPGRGCNFRLDIPADKLVSKSGEDGNDAVHVAGALRGESLRILVVDDDHDARESLALVLRQWTHEVVTAVGTQEALRLLSERRLHIDAIISDFQLAVSATGAVIDSGMHLIEQVRLQQGVSTPALVISGLHDEATRAAVTAAGAAWLPKPVRPLRLKSWLATVKRRSV